ncbi:uncharacterized protein EV420DRAFT_1641622 [Desarmillaria tabescens]|uniref:Uncharacterized protein n=1 Tax=Armillaria tabescens TaxID=1929756 RepID=A0AA39KFK1_ARMTA|nr:uncharacterized protein EV420DRAFT_1641622 [Desarmillaria tabescens]KAK0460274.1 hypothetical protein EV420DRAFT_1641622 [Desarmillaria tabescens]
MGQGPSSGPGHRSRGSWHAIDPTPNGEGESDSDSMGGSASNRKRFLHFESDLRSNWDTQAINPIRSLNASSTRLFIVGSSFGTIVLLVIVAAYMRGRRLRRLRIGAPCTDGEVVRDLEDQKIVQMADGQDEDVPPYFSIH